MVCIYSCRIRRFLYTKNRPERLYDPNMTGRKPKGVYHLKWKTPFNQLMTEAIIPLMSPPFLS